MIFHQAPERRIGFVRRAVQQGGRAEFAQFTYAVVADPAVESLAFAFADNPQMRPEHVPAIRQGAGRGRAVLAECGEWLCSVRVEVSAMLWHETAASSPAAFERLGKQFVEGKLREECVALRSLDPRWRTPDVLALARHVQRSGDHSALPALADALEEAGCDFALLLEHCRAAAGCDHEAGCWAVQLTLASPGDVLL